ncbi:bifunctional phosphoribosyl-AMP cyclohydrolase/phosphoribosyl-ATP diphosphatase HisIE [Paenibacillus sp. 481]|uniref:bifunctional phosphoribosyl-AMP cyclohydrolase/phosphoribosyl-ATP diphosphatase HisIE n=1 Tax=Paenibacillus sp. 481 TaxID=2835869 RepID=UPI001E52F1EF|nr:bifunctional phosphoribosyl-AMP cyclohydrolase/phosphoribosyl-ATP diphosphatase HisIE [Paenibacillus sp. 481]UHA75965.1 bifunctional phosphoribosyl-AMP cyclohydrolase/phosphoribosyl-ATP diphosphatase HisIE [Paenibacillus sp. 481]
MFNIDSLIERITWNEQGLVPAVVQDAVTKQVLMVAYMNRQSLKLTGRTGETVFWSRSRQSLWHKGATSGHTQRIISITLDCDADTLLIQVVPNGPACHTGQYTCFYETSTENTVSDPETTSVLFQLEQVIADREAERPEGSYTSYLFNQGVDKILKKLGEECSEVIIAAKNNDNNELCSEAGDLLFHLMVLLRERKLPLNEVLAQLKQRHQAVRAEHYNEHGKIKN